VYKRILLLAVLVAVMSATLLGAASTVQADKRKKPPEVIIIKMQDIIISSFLRDNSPGPKLALNGSLQLLSQTLLDGDTPIGIRLHTNLMDAFASNAGGTETYVAVGSSDGVPDDCTEPCLPPSWTLTFRLVPREPAGESNLLFNLTVITVYADDGSLGSACVVGQDDCGVIP
jgi:hypothetical protein